MTFTWYAQIGPNRFRERYGLCFEDFAPGQRFKHRPGITVTQQDNIDESLETLNQAMIHYDDHYAAQTEFKRPLVASNITIMRLIGMGWKTFATRERILGWSEISMLAPVFGGDTLYAETQVKSVHGEPRNGPKGRLTLITEGFNQHGVNICRMEYDALIWRRAHLPFAQANY
ncbi:MAG: MaoC family dehydratase [Alphaproteobacteria bacterium]|nr:MaoC family dehydratase [Alphaproteobacteria bacterium]